IIPDEIDSVLLKYPGVQESKTIGLHHDVVGESICSICKTDPQTSPPSVDDVKRFVRGQIAAFKCPDRIVFMSHLPRTAAGKIFLPHLKKIVTGELSVEIYQHLDADRYNRAPPSERSSIVELIQQGLLDGTGIMFLSYWGCSS